MHKLLLLILFHYKDDYIDYNGEVPLVDLKVIVGEFTKDS